MSQVGVRLQNLELTDQVLVVARVSGSRSTSGLFAPSEVEHLFDELGLPRPPKAANQIAALAKHGLLTSVKKGEGRATWKLTPKGREHSANLASDMDLAALVAESAVVPMTRLGEMAHPVVPPSLAPPELILPLHEFCEEYPFERNVFGMTRFPGKPEGDELDPLVPAIEAAREVCAEHGLVFHLASDRKIVDDLWPNVAAHLWGSRYGVAFFEERTGEGLNYNLNIEVGSAMALGRRIAILKDEPIAKLPTDLVGRIYHEVDLGKAATIRDELDRWIRDDLKASA